MPADRLRNSMIGLFLLLFALGSAQAIELLELRGLPDAGFGSEALGFIGGGSGADKMEVVGDMTLPPDLRVPVHWRHDVATGETALVGLPIVAGATGVANDIEAVPVTDQCLAAGTMTPPGGDDQAVFWVEVPHGDQHEPEWYDGLMLPDFGSGSHANELALVPGETRADVVGGVTLRGGGALPIVWSIDWITGGVQTTDLLVPEGAEGTATSITRGSDGRLVVAGTLTRDGRTRAARWDLGEGGPPAILSTPRGADSVADGGGQLPCFPGSPVVSSGAICTGAACRATLWGPGGGAINLHTNAAFSGSQALSDAVCRGALVLAGTMSDAIGPVGGPVGALFLPQASLAADINRLLTNPEDGPATVVHAIDETGLMVGSGNVCDLPNIDCGIIFVPIGGRIASEQVRVRSGSITGGDATATWQDDDATLRLRPPGSGSPPAILAGFGAQQIVDANSTGWDALLLNVSGRSQDAGATFGARVQLYNVTNEAWETVGQFEATTTETEFVIPVAGGAAPFVDASSRIRSRLQIRRTEGSGPWEFEIDRFLFGEDAGGQ